MASAENAQLVLLGARGVIFGVLGLLPAAEVWSPVVTGDGAEEEEAAVFYPWVMVTCTAVGFPPCQDAMSKPASRAWDSTACCKGTSLATD